MDSQAGPPPPFPFPLGFLVVPVLDIRDGLVVHARRGERAAYRPLVSPLAATASPLDVVRGLLALHPFRALYVADLDAIEHRAPQFALVDAIREAFAPLDVWLDAGIRTAADYAAARRHGTPVIGSETLARRSADAVLARAASGGPHEPVLSIDVRDDQFLGPRSILDAAPRWPRRVIAMSLRRVGAGAGPDLDLAARIRALSPSAEVFASGGVRDVADLRAARDAGCAGALVATCLHERRVGAAELATIDQPARRDAAPPARRH
ncbi:MAG TPA: HisA/HisF-related TIM barrel protein [Burkholderiaceae bacterium]|nr:HisA/HisF-related TIM barrel protein [Burkholderiaceae bacterium]